MTWPLKDLLSVIGKVDYAATGRISRTDADRQHATLTEVLRRLATQPGLILADEVGMGKTFVALGAAYLAAMQDPGGNPAVVMIPPSLRDKWPRDADLFAERCLQAGVARPRIKSAETGLEFFRLLDDPRSKRAQIIFLHHGAFLLTRIDSWTKLALVRRAMHGMRLGEVRSALPRFAGRILRASARYNDPELYRQLLEAPYEEWRSVVNEFYEDDPTLHLDDDPIPERISRVLERGEIDVSALRAALGALPARESRYSDERLQEARDALRDALRDVWPRILAGATFRSPLLILDEAHHLKNSGTRLASLFADSGKEDVNLLKGALRGRFERMLFLTATPFQLGHHELVDVLRRFEAIQWKSLSQFDAGGYRSTLDTLLETLDRAQIAACDFDRKWRCISASCGPSALGDDALNAWWADVVQKQGASNPALDEALRSLQSASTAMRAAEQALRTWIIRHQRSALLPDSKVLRRLRHIGRSIDGRFQGSHEGLPVADDQLLPFLLAARAQSVAERSASGRYTTFSDGLASSYEAFLETSRHGATAVDDVAETATSSIDSSLKPYIDRLREILPNPSHYGDHPKIAAVVNRVVELWSLGEKVVVFCHFRRTGQALVRHLSDAIQSRLWKDLTQRTGIPEASAPDLVARFGNRFDADDAMARYLSAAVRKLVAEEPGIAADETTSLLEIIRRFVRSPIFVARYFDPSQPSSEALMADALNTRDGSGITLEARLRAFLKFFSSRNEGERREYLNALERVQPGLRGELITDGEDHEIRATLLPNVRLANGATDQDARQRLMLSFNTPFFPDVLVASSVLAEGVDLHLNCRHLIHHDLSWNPSDIEQRTGRVDRLGSKAERASAPVEVYLPFVAETQDEKQYRVVMDRERWFQVLMGEEYKSDEAGSGGPASIQLPPALVVQLSYNLALSPNATR
jgi:hypothetical protein